MGPYLQLRRWLRQAPQGEVALSIGGGVLVLVLVLWAVFPTGRVPERSMRSTDPAGVDHQIGAAPAPPALDDSGVETGSSPTPVGQSGVAPPADPSVELAPRTAVPPAGAGTSASGEESQPSGPAEPTGRPASALRATDRGVTAEQIKVGFMVASLRNLDQSGRVLGLREDAPEAIDALVNHLNENGGIHGREVVPVTVKVDPLDASDQRAKCLYLTETEQVFGALDVVSTGVNSTSQACFTIEHETPFVHFVPFSEDFMRSGFPYDVSTQGNLNYYAKQWVLAARDLGFFNPEGGFEKLGILSDACFPEALDTANGIKGYLQQVGIGPEQISDFRTACDIPTAQRQVPQAVLQHRQDGVTHVFIATSGPSMRNYLQQANALLFFPEYFDSDFLGSTNTTVAAGNDPEQWDRVRAVTGFYDGAHAAGHPLPPRAQKCSRVLEEHGVPPITGYEEDTEIVAFCELFDLFVEITRAAGPELTRVAWGESVPSVGNFEGAKVQFGRFDRPGKVTGADRITIVEWRRECRCWYQIEGWRDAY